MDRLAHWRQKIDLIDVQLVALLNERARYAEEIGRAKLEVGLDPYSPDREEEVMQNVIRENRGPLSVQAIRRLYERIIDESRAVERHAMEEKRRNESNR